MFCSWGDNITPPQQALGWILDLYDDEQEIVENGQTIVYTMHQSIGHLGIFVSGKVATKEHGEFVIVHGSDRCDAAWPVRGGHTEVDEDTVRSATGAGPVSFPAGVSHAEDIRALGGNDAHDDQRFATVARVSEINLGLYRTLLAPMVRAAMTEPAAEAIRALHPNRLRFGVFSDQNPFMQPVKALANSVRATRQPVSPDNPLLAIEQAASSWITSCLQALASFAMP